MCVRVYICERVNVSVLVSSLYLHGDWNQGAFYQGWPLQGLGRHQLRQPVKWALQNTADYMECKTLEKCVLNIRAACLKWQKVGEK